MPQRRPPRTRRPTRPRRQPARKNGMSVAQWLTLLGLGGGLTTLYLRTRKPANKGGVESHHPSNYKNARSTNSLLTQVSITSTTAKPLIRQRSTNSSKASTTPAKPSSTRPRPQMINAETGNYSLIRNPSFGTQTIPFSTQGATNLGRVGKNLRVLLPLGFTREEAIMWERMTNVERGNPETYYPKFGWKCDMFEGLTSLPFARDKRLNAMVQFRKACGHGNKATWSS